jgi:hypothetical protein
MRHENVSGSFETTSFFRNVHTRHELVYGRKVVTDSLVDQVLSLRNRTFFWNRLTTSPASVSRIPKDMTGLFVHAT